MIAAFLTGPDASPTVHAVYEVGQHYLKVKARGYCATEGNAADGTYQVPDWAFDGRKTYVNLATNPPQAWVVCEGCSTFVKGLRDPR